MLVAVAGVLAVAACSGGDGGGASGAAPPATLPDELAAPTTAAPGGSTTTAGGAPVVTTTPSGCGLCLSVDAPLRCEGETVGATARWVDRGARAAGLLLDGTAVTGAVPPAGPFELSIPCDGKAHTVVLAVSLAGGGTEQSSAAVRSSPVS